MSTHIFGVRHHGPGCARSLRAALTALQPDIVLVEGPPDAHSALPLLASPEMEPPVALLLYIPSEPQRAVYYPFTTFSPEWQALQYALGHDIPARFMDLPQAFQFARAPAYEDDIQQSDTPLAADPSSASAAAIDETTSAPANPAEPIDPIGMLAQAAGYADHELWWEREIEQRHDANGLFEGILEAMQALRSDLAPRDVEGAQREAYMRQTIRAAQHEGFTRIAVVCGAWHAPALAPLATSADGDASSAKADAAILAGLKRVKVDATWIPWTNSRLAYRSGYGAGVASPGWYAHLWHAADRGATHWVAQAAHLLRAEGIDASSASVIEAVRLGDALAALRALPMPGMAELHEAIQTVLCAGDETPMQLIRNKLEIGEHMGAVPAETPAVPLQRDLEATQRRLKLKPAPEPSSLALDLRKELDRARSQLLHRLRLLRIDWGTPLSSPAGAKGTFHETWQLEWQVEFTVTLIEQNVWGNTVEVAASRCAQHAADAADDLPRLTALLDRVILAELPEAIDHVLGCVESRAAVAADVQHLMRALPPLARVARYSDVRRTRAERILPVIDSLFARAVIGLPGACASLDDAAAAAMVTSIDAVHQTIHLLERDDLRATWLPTLRALVDRESIHGLVRGRCTRLLLEQHQLTEAELRRLARLALSPVVPTDQAAAWIEGVLRGSGLLLLHQDGLWAALDGWLADLTPDAFIAILPLLRRAFADFQGPELRAMGEKVRHLRATTATGAPTPDTGRAAEAIDQARAALVLPVLAQLLGVTYDADNS